MYVLISYYPSPDLIMCDGRRNLNRGIPEGILCWSLGFFLFPSTYKVILLLLVSFHVISCEGISWPPPLVTKSLTMLGCFMDYVGYRDPQLGDKYFKMFLENCNVGYAEVSVLRIYEQTMREMIPHTDEGQHCSAFLYDYHQSVAFFISLGWGTLRSLSNDWRPVVHPVRHLHT